MFIVGKLINSSRKPIAEAMRGRNNASNQKLAEMQAESGAHFIDVNAGAFIGQEEMYLKWR
jgi:cobalamin-dependent methionine synthase I